jgi:hypothetical protein
MSYNIIKTIKIVDGKVLIKACSNNVYPHTYYEDVCGHSTKILTEQGPEALDLDLLAAYESGEFQRGSNKYTRALEILRHLPEYKSFDWRRPLSAEDNTDKRKSPEFQELLKKALSMKLPKEKFTIKKDYHGRTVYFKKITRRAAYWTAEKSEAKLWNYREDCEDMKKNFTGSESWETEQIK